MLWAPVPDRSKPLLISTGYWIPCCRWQASFLWCSTHIGPWEFSAGYWMSPLLWWNVPTTPQVVGLHRDCSKVPSLLKLQYCIEGGEQEKQVHGDGKTHWMILDPTRNAASCSKSPFGVPRDKRKEQENQRQSKIGGRVHRWVDTPSSFRYSGGGCPSQPSQFIPEGWMRWVTNTSWSTGFLFSTSASVSPVIGWKVLTFTLSFLTRGGSRWYAHHRRLMKAHAKHSLQG